MKLTPQSIIVFQQKHLCKAENFCRNYGGSWTIINAFDNKLENFSNANIKYVDLFADYPYQPKQVTKRVCDLINLIYSNTFVNGRSLNDFPSVDGVPLLRAKDNEVMEYILHRLVFIIDTLLEALKLAGQKKVWLLTDKLDQFTVPEWPNFELMVNFDAFYGPVFAQAAADMSIEVKFASAIRQSRSVWLHRVREIALMTRRIASIILRWFRWRRMSNILDINSAKVGIFVRSKSQVKEVEPMVRIWLNQEKVYPFFIQDDSFKKQDCFNYLDTNSDLPAVSLYAFLTPVIFLRGLLLYFWFRFIGISKMKFFNVKSKAKMSVDAVILSPSFRRELFKSLSETLFASSILVEEMTALHSKISFTTMMVMSNFDLWGNLSGYVSKSCGFKTISVQNFNSDPWAYPTPCTLYDAHVCFDHLERNKLLRAGASSEKLFALGSVLHSNLRNIKTQLQGRVAARSRVALDEQTIAILVGTQSASYDSSSENKHLLELLFEIVVENKNMMGFVKLHPYDNISNYLKWTKRAKSEGLPIQFLENWNIEEALNLADAYISRYSTTMLLGVLQRKPTLSFTNEFELVRAKDSVDFIRLGIITSVTNHAEARLWVSKLYSQNGFANYVSCQEQLLLRNFSTYDEKGQERIQKLIESFLESEFPLRELQSDPAGRSSKVQV